jgi:hypothetical protein
MFQIFTIKTTSFIPPSVTKLYLYVCIRLYMFRFSANHLQTAHQHCKGNYHFITFDVFVYHVMIVSFTMLMGLLKMVC